MKQFIRTIWTVLFVLSCGCARQPTKTDQNNDALSQYRLILTEYDGPSMGAGLAGWEVMELDLPNSRIRLLQKRVAYTYFTNGIPPATPPYNIESLRKAICDIPWRPLPNQEVSSLHKLIHAWIETSPPANYGHIKNDLGWPRHTTVTVESPHRNVTSVIDCRLPCADDTEALRAMLFRLSYLTALWKKDTQPSPAGDSLKAAPEE
jgi:hypothetical protein